MNKAKIAVLVSGGGTNLQALIDAQASGILHSGEIVLVISGKAGAYALERAEKAGIATATVVKKECGSQEAFEEQIAFAQLHGNDRLLQKTVLSYIFSIHDHLGKAIKVYRKELRRKLRAALKLGRECGCFPRNRQNSWAYEAAYPCKPLWWLMSKVQK